MTSSKYKVVDMTELWILMDNSCELTTEPTTTWTTQKPCCPHTHNLYCQMFQLLRKRFKNSMTGWGIFSAINGEFSLTITGELGLSPVAGLCHCLPAPQRPLRDLAQGGLVDGVEGIEVEVLGDPVPAAGGLPHPLPLCDLPSYVT